MNVAVAQINRLLSFEKIAEVVRDELGSDLIEDLNSHGYFTYSQMLAVLNPGYEREVVEGAAKRVAFLSK